MVAPEGKIYPYKTPLCSSGVLTLCSFPSVAAVVPPPPVTDSSSTVLSNAGPESSQLEARASSRHAAQAGKGPAQPRPTTPPPTSEGKRCEQVGPTRFEEEDGFGAA